MKKREEVIKYIEENKDREGKREIEKDLKIKGDERVYMKEMLSEIEDEGIVEKRERKI